MIRVEEMVDFEEKGAFHYLADFGQVESGAQALLESQQALDGFFVHGQFQPRLGAFN